MTHIADLVRVLQQPKNLEREPKMTTDFFQRITLDNEGTQELAELASSVKTPSAREAIASLLRVAQANAVVCLADPDNTLSPTRAAEHLKMSRTHLYKLLDRGEIPCHYVGTHRRIKLSDLLRFKQQRDHDRLELAEMFANRESIQKSAADSIAAHL